MSEKIFSMADLDGLFPEEGRCDFMGELREAASEYFLLHPGADFDQWRQGMLDFYPTEIVDALGTDPVAVSGTLKDLYLALSEGKAK